MSGKVVGGETVRRARHVLRHNSSSNVVGEVALTTALHLRISGLSWKTEEWPECCTWGRWMDEKVVVCSAVLSSSQAAVEGVLQSETRGTTGQCLVAEMG